MNMSGEMLIGIEEKLESILDEQCWRHADLSEGGGAVLASIKKPPVNNLLTLGGSHINYLPELVFPHHIPHIISKLPNFVTLSKH